MKLKILITLIILNISNLAFAGTVATIDSTTSSTEITDKSTVGIRQALTFLSQDELDAFFEDPLKSKNFTYYIGHSYYNNQLADTDSTTHRRKSFIFKWVNKAEKHVYAGIYQKRVIEAGVTSMYICELRLAVGKGTLTEDTTSLLKIRTEFNYSPDITVVKDVCNLQ